MSKQKIEEITCNNCNFVFATVFKNNEQYELQVHKGLGIKVINKEKLLGSLTCPDCGNEQSTDLGFWSKF